MHQLNLPEPSKLYSLKPLGLGTANTESLASYAMRLAEAHCIYVSDLIHRFIYPLIGTEWKDTPAKRGFNKMNRLHRHTVTLAHLHIGKWIDVTEETQATVIAISTLTKRTDLNLLTLLPLYGYIEQHTALRYQRAWCPCCYEDQKNLGKPIYDLLIWSFRDVCVCSQHKQRLQSGCFWCGKAQPVINFRSEPGYCMDCNLWLGGEPKGLRIADSQELWRADAIGNFIAEWSNLPPCQVKRSSTIEKLLSESYRTKRALKDLLI